MNMRKFLAGGFLIIFTLSLPYPNLQAINSVPSLGEATRLSLKQREELGRSWLRTNYNSLNPTEDILLYHYTDEIIKRLKRGEALTRYRFNVVVLNSREFNAFAVPGGVLGFNLGLFLLAENEDEFSSVVAHELAHLSQEHFLRRLEWSRSNNALSLGAIFTGLALALSGNFPLGAATIYGTLGYQNEEYLRLSRQFEDEADSQAIPLLANAGFDTRGMGSMLSRLKTLEGTQSLAVYGRTHPLTSTRVNNALLLGGRQNSLKSSLTSDYSFARQRALFLAGRTEGKYSSTLASLKDSKYEGAIKALEELEHANPYSRVVFYTLLDAIIQSGAANVALKKIQDRQRVSIKDPMLDYYSALAYAKQRKYEQAVEYMESFSKNYPEYPPIWLDISNHYLKLNDKYNLFRARGIYYLLTGDNNKMEANFNLAKKEAADDEIKNAELDKDYRFY